MVPPAGLWNQKPTCAKHDQEVSWMGETDDSKKSFTAVFPVADLLGIRFISHADGRATAELEAKPQFANPMGTLHGGILCDLADATMGVAFASTLSAGESFTTLELKMNFLRPFWTGRLNAEAVV